MNPCNESQTLGLGLSNQVQESRTMDKATNETQSPITESTPTSEGSNGTIPSSTSDLTEVDAKDFRGQEYSMPTNAEELDDYFGTFTTWDSPVYDLHIGTKLAVVFNHESFLPSTELPNRRGTESDCQAILSTFKERLGFEVRIYDDQTFAEINKVIEGIQEERNLSCLVLFILTHGEESNVLFASDSSYRFDRDIMEKLLPNECPSLAGKPKLIFVQACQGQRTDDGAMVSVRQRSRHTSTDGPPSCRYKIPHYSDFLVFLAAYKGFYSFRSRSGSWLIQSLCKVIDKSGHEDSIHTILTRVKHHVALYKTSNSIENPEHHQKKQIPVAQDTLIRELYLKKHLSPSPRRQIGQVESKIEANIIADHTSLEAVNSSKTRKEPKSKSSSQERCKFM